MEYYNEDSLFKYFTQEIAETSRLEMEAIQKEIDAIKQRELAKIELEVKHQVGLSLGAELKDLQTNYRNEINQLIAESGKRLLERRNAIVEEVFSEVSKRLTNFRDTPDYAANVQSRLKHALGGLNGLNLMISIAEHDAVARKLIQESAPLATIAETKAIRYGGFVMVDEDASIEIDQTIDSSLEAMKQWFYTNSKLFVK
jgi:vacuolar-type H+-ATPase subunit E/Vma4